HLAGAMRMRVLLGRSAVRRPARVADTGCAAERLVVEEGRQVVELADAAPHLDVVIDHGRQPRRVVAPVLELAESTYEDGARVACPDVADDPAHRLSASAAPVPRCRPSGSAACRPAASCAPQA